MNAPKRESPVAIRHRPGDVVLTLDREGKVVGREIVRGGAWGGETLGCALALALVAAGTGIVLLLI